MWQLGSRKHFPETAVDFSQDQLQDHMVQQVTHQTLAVFMQKCCLVASVRVPPSPPTPAYAVVVWFPVLWGWESPERRELTVEARTAEICAVL